MTKEATRRSSSMPIVRARESPQEVPVVELGVASFALSKTVGSGTGGRQRTRAWASDTEVSFAPPSGYRVVAVDTESCDRVRDLSSLRRDLELAKLFAETYMDRASSRAPGERFADDALWMSALVMYGRAFGSSVRTSERLSDDWLNAGERAVHGFLLDLRNKFVAHAVNNFEHAVVIAYLPNSAFESRNVARIGQMHAELVAPSEEHLRGIIDLCSRYIVHINRRLRAALGDVSAELEILGLDEVYALPDLAPPKFDDARVAKRRK